ncbi:hypothetical protein BVX97_02150 [bacterium E08(2017)]|nr:hypothetical protein BVX97_02150 [bacterium E08(2017)]
MKNRNIYVLVALIILAQHLCAATRLVVTSDGKSFWVSSIKQEGDILRYYENQTGEEKEIALDKVHGVIPSVTKGKHYTPGEIEKYINRIKKLKVKHKGLYRQLQTMQQEWEALQKPNPELEADIDKLKTSYDASDKSTAAYKQTVLDYGMIRYKDMQGKYAPKIDNLLEEIRSDYVAVNKARLEKQAAGADQMGFDAFIDFQTLAEYVAKEAKGGDKTAVEGMLQEVRTKVYDSQSRAAYTRFIRTKSIDAYLESARILYGLKENVAVTDEQKARVDKSMESLKAMVLKSNGGWQLTDKGFPLNRERGTMLSQLGHRASVNKMTYEDYNEEVLVIPERSPDNQIKWQRPFSFPMQAFIQRAQPAGRKFAFIITYPGAETFIKELGSIKFKDGMATVNLKDDFQGASGMQIFTNDEMGRYFFYFHLAYETTDEKGERAWKPISHRSVWPILP